ncbi:MAG: hypothetical protein JO138_08105 [Acidobacteriaceae bacterium]|nr:hypothetical protein [Acidobacteriaceae bacterium]
MRFWIGSTVICSGLLLSAVGVHAQSYGYPPDGADPSYGQPTYGRSYEGWGGMALFEHVEDDLDRAAMDLYGSRRHINHARKEVEDVEHQLRRGRFDRDEMGEAISAVQHVLDNDPLPNVDRSILWRDLAQMRRFRDREY